MGREAKDGESARTVRAPASELLRVGHRSGGGRGACRGEAPGRSSERAHVPTRSPGSLAGRRSCLASPHALVEWVMIVGGYPGARWYRALLVPGMRSSHRCPCAGTARCASPRPAGSMWAPAGPASGTCGAVGTVAQGPGLPCRSRPPGVGVPAALRWGSRDIGRSDATLLACQGTVARDAGPGSDAASLPAGRRVVLAPAGGRGPASRVGAGRGFQFSCQGAQFFEAGVIGVCGVQGCG